jgi:hypothetical protein
MTSTHFTHYCLTAAEHSIQHSEIPAPRHTRQAWGVPPRHTTMLGSFRSSLFSLDTFDSADSR